MIAIDTETTGVDFRHGSRPFFVTVCREDEDPLFWEWPVDPETREVRPPAPDLEEIRSLVLGDPTEELVLHNSKFDVTALETVMGPLDWPWGRTHDTLVASHLLESNRPHDLTALAQRYLGVDILPLEEALGVATKDARSLARRKYKSWRQARQDDEDMPSVKGEKAWRADSWLPSALALVEGYDPDHSWRRALREYAVTDSFVTARLWPVLRHRIAARRLGAIYETSLKRMRLAYTMQRDGVTVNGHRLGDTRRRYAAHSESHGRACVAIAAQFPDPSSPGDPDPKVGRQGYHLELPANGVNGSLRRFVFDVLGLPGLRNPKAKTDAPTLNKAAIEHYLDTLPPDSVGYRFVHSLVTKRGYDTAVGFMDAYRRFWRPVPGSPGYYLLHPDLNPCGTDTLRWSCKNPNEQNISKREGLNVRCCFAPLPDEEWWSIDAKNIELRIPAYDSMEPELIDIFERPDDPPYYGSTHLLNFHTVYPDIWERELQEVGPDKVGPHVKKKYEATWYKWCKNGGFAVQYGAVDRPGGGGTADRAFHRNGSHARLRSRFSRLDGLNQRCVSQANRFGHVETMPDRTVDPRRGYPLLCSRSDWGGVTPTQPLSYRVSGTAMWWTMMSMIRCDEVLTRWRREDSGPPARMVMQVHDEMVFAFPRAGHPRDDRKRSNWRYVLELVAAMEVNGENLLPRVPTPVGVEYHDVSWDVGFTCK